MSYARMGVSGSDVYVFEDANGGFECCNCHLAKWYFNCKTATEMMEHLLEHRRVGHTVPQYTIDALKRLDERKGD